MKKAKVILLSGQSNAVGVGHTKYLSKYFDEKTINRFNAGYEKVLIHYVSHNMKNESFEPVRVGQAEKYRKTLGPEIGIAKKLTEKYPDEEFFIIKCAFENCTYIDAAISDVWENYEAMNERKRVYAEKMGHRYIDTIAEGLTTRNEPEDNPDVYHYDLDSTVKLGELFADNI